MAKITNEAIYQILLRVEKQTEKTNGRVSELEKRANKRDGAFGVIVWVIVAIALPVILMLVDNYLI